MANKYQERWKMIIRDWQEQFPFLKPYGSVRLMYRTDILLVGLLMERSKYGGHYKIEFEVKPLWDILMDNYHYCIEYPIIDNSTKAKAGYYVAFGDYNPNRPNSYKDNHDFYFGRILKSIEQQYGNIFDGCVESGFLLNILDLAYPNTARRYVLKSWFFYTISNYYELQLALALYFNDSDSWNKVYSEIENNMIIWEKELIKRKKISRYEISFLFDWKNTIDKILKDRDWFMTICEENSKLSKVKCLNKGRIVYTPYTPLNHTNKVF